ncbi:hypothetical protein N8I77_009391 [Diaporthe amygdali]|uniref:MYND-type domain-containing protein n=1 Tax=Phomopsis amygdali TaxID=1214568 RepID=A0AAD9S9P1_PHOAM|nr:hypothetical protein N8I77_009391 [Diaporthe amygdali]
MAQHFDYNSLSDEDYFPSWNNLPVFTLMHICFLAEIQQCDGFMRYRTLVKDSDGEVRVVAFYPDSYEGFDFGQLKRGHTLAIMNARQHQFGDGTYGVRVENMDDVCVFPAGLQTLRSLGSEAAIYAVDGESEQWKCHGCDAVKPHGQMSRCGQCKTYAYCSKECQAKGWTEKGHKSGCKVLRGSNFLSLLKLDFMEGPEEEPFSFQQG